jgi:DNA-damage-inducible protein D
MKTEIIQTLVNDFESRANKTEDGVEFWLARDLQQLLGYTKWDNFVSVITTAKIACEMAKCNVSDHCADVGKMIKVAKARKEKYKIRCLLATLAT